MQKGSRKAMLALVVTAACWGIASSGWAEDEIANVRANGAFRKLGRGVANILTCPLELIRVPSLVARKDGNIAGWTVGVFKGATLTLIRGVTGVYEVLSFYAEVPAGYEPILKPEFVWAHGHWSE